ncbi:hypothetical protein [Leptolyngbya sp. NIES-2104]|uniref:hypothetical protein n=1 Tax=Leptolyngbya sp. NIES-2104 TaxID=1552121 RepID=UPI0006EC987D|nr:hypothetical protein [Leptolyngbya sp. NIES-2104]GAP99553.1 hypothetical protein NIES2104_61190 [Leptolyngbya sp. NIES-2104]
MNEWDNQFLSLFPHRYDYIWAEHPHSGAKVNWQTETRHPLSDRLIQQGAYLYGVRFGAETQYCLLDIDVRSPYHPNRDPFAIKRIAEALEPLGLVEYIICTSSYSGGLHLYFPFSKAQSSWQFAIAVATLLENSGFKLIPGQLETFPNPKPYIAGGTPSLFNSHRLPMQTGSYLLNQEFQPIWSTQQTFIQRWQFAQNRNDLDTKTLKQILKQAKRRVFQVSGKAEKFINDLNAEIELGWTGYGQTNRLLGRIAMRSYIFHHVLSGGQPLEGEALIKAIVETAKALPGYQEWCRHQHEIEHRAEEWANCIQSSHYFHYGEPQGKFKAKSEVLESANTAWREACDQAPSWNQQQLESARDRIRSAIVDLLEKGTLPINATARFKVLVQYKIGGGSLYRHRDLWHPSFLTDASFGFSELDLDQKQQYNQNSNPTLEVENTASLLPSNGGNSNPSNAPNALILHHSDSIGRNTLWNQPCKEIAQDSQNLSIEPQTVPEQQAWQEAHQAAMQIAQQQHSTEREPSESQLVQMQQYFDSGDPILQAEALAWSRFHPGWLRLDSLHCDRESISD